MKSLSNRTSTHYDWPTPISREDYIEGSQIPKLGSPTISEESWMGSRVVYSELLLRIQELEAKIEEPKDKGDNSSYEIFNDLVDRVAKVKEDVPEDTLLVHVENIVTGRGNVYIVCGGTGDATLSLQTIASDLHIKHQVPVIIFLHEEYKLLLKRADREKYDVTEFPVTDLE